jgi:hypothetical protein
MTADKMRFPSRPQQERREVDVSRFAADLRVT